MTLRRSKAQNLIQGLSQQPAEVRLPGQLESCDNCWPSPVEGLGKRPPTSHVAELDTQWYRDAFVHTIDRDADEQYLAMLSHQSVRIFDTGGNEASIVNYDTNFLTNPRNLTHPDWWTLLNSGFESEWFDGRKDATESADGSRKADLISFHDNFGSTDAVAQEMANALFTDGNTYLLEAEVKYADATKDFTMFVGFESVAALGNWPFVRIDATTATVVDSGNNLRSGIIDLGNGWVRVYLLFTLDATTLNAAGWSNGTVRAYLYPTFDGDDSFTGGDFGEGGHYIDNVYFLDLDNADRSYLDLEEDNLVTDPNGFSTSWLTNTNTDPVASTAVVGPFGYSTYTELKAKAARTGPATYYQNIGTIGKGWNFFSCFFKEKGTSTDAEESWVGMVGPVLQRVTMTWTAGVPAITFVSEDVEKYGIEDMGGGEYMLWGAINGANVQNHVVGNARQIYVTIDDSDSASQKTIYAWGARALDGIKHPSEAPHIDPRRRLRAVTVEDSTLVSNDRITAAFTSDLSPGFSEDVAFLFVKKGVYSGLYSAEVQLGDDTAVTAALTTVNAAGAATQSEGYAKWKVEFVKAENGTYTLTLNDGAIFGPWSLTYTASGVSADDAYQRSLLAERFTNAARAVLAASDDANYISIEREAAYSPVVYITATIKNVALSLTVAAEPTAGDVTVTELFDPSGANEGAGNYIQDIRPDAIASALAGILDNASANITTYVSGPVVKIVASTETIRSIQAKGRGSDEDDSELLQVVWQQVEDITDLPVICERDYTVQITGSAASDTDDVWVKFEPFNFDDEEALEAQDNAMVKGSWVETVKPNLPYKLDPATLPIQLIRKKDTTAAVTGVTDRIYFEYRTIDWSERAAGSEKTAPKPSFLGSSIRGLFFHKNRLGFLSQDNVLLSQVGSYFNFFRTTTQSLLDSDPIDISNGRGTVTKFNHAEMVGDDMFLFAERDIMALKGEPALTPATATLLPKLRQPCSERALPAAIGRNALICSSNSSFTRVYEVYQSGATDNQTLYDSTDLTAALPKHLQGDPRQVEASLTQDVAAFLTKDDRQTLYLYKHFTAGERKLQSAWVDWTFSDAYVLGVGFMSNSMYLLLERTVGSGDVALTMEVIELGEGLTDPDSTFVTLLDRRVSDETPGVSSAYAASATTFTLPHKLDTNATYQVVTRGANGGQYYSCTTNPASMTVTTDDDVDLSSTDVWIGQQYTASAGLTRPLPQTQSITGGIDFISEGRYQVLRALVTYSDAAEFQVDVTPSGYTAVTTTYNDGKSSGSGVTIADGVLDLGVQADSKGLAMTLKNSSPTPAAWLGVEYLCEHSPNYR